MEREEAIFENENNSNLESESNNRQQFSSLNERSFEPLLAEEEEDEIRIRQHNIERASTSSTSHSHDETKLSSTSNQVEESEFAQKAEFEQSFQNEKEETSPNEEANASNDISGIDLEKVNESRDDEMRNSEEDTCQLKVSSNTSAKEVAIKLGEQNKLTETKRNPESSQWTDEKQIDTVHEDALESDQGSGELNGDDENTQRDGNEESSLRDKTGKSDTRDGSVDSNVSEENTPRDGNIDVDVSEEKATRDGNMDLDVHEENTPRDRNIDLDVREENSISKRDRSEKSFLDVETANNDNSVESQVHLEASHRDGDGEPNLNEGNAGRDNIESFMKESDESIVNDDDDDFDLLQEDDYFHFNRHKKENLKTNNVIEKNTSKITLDALSAVSSENENYRQSTEKSDGDADIIQTIEDKAVSEQDMDSLDIGKNKGVESEHKEEESEAEMTSGTKNSTLIEATVSNKEEADSPAGNPKEKEMDVDESDRDVEKSGEKESPNVEKDTEMPQEVESDDLKESSKRTVEDGEEDRNGLTKKKNDLKVNEKIIIKKDQKETELLCSEKSDETVEESENKAGRSNKNNEIEFVEDIVMIESENDQSLNITCNVTTKDGNSVNQDVTDNDMGVDESCASVTQDQDKDLCILQKKSETIEKAEDECKAESQDDEEVVVINVDKDVEEIEEVDVEMCDIDIITDTYGDESKNNVEVSSRGEPSNEGMEDDSVSSKDCGDQASNEASSAADGNKKDKENEQMVVSVQELESSPGGVTEVKTSKENIGKGKVSTLKSIEVPKSESDLMKSKASTDETDDDVIVMHEVKKEADVDYRVSETIAQDVRTEPTDITELKSEVIVVDDEQDPGTSKKADDKKPLETGLGIQIAAVSGQQHQLHANACDGLVSPMLASSGDSDKTNNKSQSKSKTQTCIVCHTVTRCKYNIVRNGDTKQLCGDVCFKRFRNNPNRYLEREKAMKAAATSKPSQPPVSKTPAASTSAMTPQAPSPGSSKQPTSSAAATTAAAAVVPSSSAPAKTVSESSQLKTCYICQVMNINAAQKFCNWKGFDFCGESCLAKFQATLNNKCSFCSAYIPIDMRASFCLKIGSDMRPFCKQRCYQEFKKNLRMCAYCQKDLLSFASVTAKVGMDSKAKEFCSWACVKKLEGECDDVQIVSVKMGKTAENGTCSVCKVQGRAVKHSVRFQSKTFNLCSDICLSAFQYTNKINVNKCDSCGMVCTSIEAQVHFIQFEGQTKRFCSDKCVNTFRTGNRKVVDCTWCATKNTNFDMIERLDEDNKFQLFCSLNCLSLYRVNLQAKSNMAVQCDQCKKVVPAQYHLTMSDASVRNFCTYSCVMTFQSQFTQKAVPQRKPQPQTPTPSPPVQPRASPSHPHGTRSKGRQKGGGSQTEVAPPTPPTPKTPTPKTPTPKTPTPAVPVISDVVSLASDEDKGSSVQSGGTAASLVHTLQKKGNLFSGDGKERIVVRAPSPTQYRNKSLQCRPFTQTKATSCRPHSQSKEVQTEKETLKPFAVPVPVPIYVPMPTVMYNAPAPILIPVPIPIPVPIFIPTTRKSSNGIMKAIKEIVERMPSDPLEAELLMMAAAVASDGKRPGDSDTDSEQDVCANDDEDVDVAELQSATGKGANPLMAAKSEGAGEEDMIQMALRMAEEMSGPMEDLENSVEPSVVKTESERQSELEVPVFDNQIDSDYSPSKSGRGRGAKRPGRGRPPNNSRPKRQKTGSSSYVEADIDNSPLVSAPQNMSEPPPDHNHRLKFTFGVNAWKNWVVGKNSELERSRRAGNTRMRPLPTDILKCTMDELNYSLFLFIKEVRKPNGEIYSPDSIFYLCLGIQQYLYENGRIENIFTDLYFQRFTDTLHELVKTLQPKVNSQGQMLCRIEEEHLWESKQLGAHSPYILLNTLIYFHTKHFILKTATEHMSLSFAQILKHLKKGVSVKAGSGAASKNVSLRFYCLANKKDVSNVASKKGKDVVPIFEVTENFVNPLRCPVKLYEFFLSKCPESIKNRNDIFYPVPERSCVPDSPVWYSTQSVDLKTMDKMLTRILLVREIQEAHLHAQAIFMKI